MSDRLASGDRLVAEGATAMEIDKQGRVRFDHPNLHNGVEWIDAGYRPRGVVKGDMLDIYYVWVPHTGYYVAKKSN